MLNDRAIKTAKPMDKPYRLYDERGLYLEVSRTGAKLWRYKFSFQGREKRLALGAYPDVSLADARDLRDDARRLVAKGQDPAQVKATEKAKANGGDTFEAIARDWHESMKGQLSPGHWKRQLERLNGNAFPYLGARQIDSIQPMEWLRVLKRVEERGAFETAKRIKIICSQVYAFARAFGRANTDPLRDLHQFMTPTPDSHYASITDRPEDLKPILLAIDGYEGSTIVRTALRLAPHVFVRPGELRSMRWADVDLAAAQWRFTASKTGQPHIVPLSRQALALLEDIKPLTGSTAFVFPSPRSSMRCISDGTLNAGLKALGIDTQEEMTSHGWRACARTMLEEHLGYEGSVIELQLAHVVKDANGSAYNRVTALAKRTLMMQAWSDFLDGIKGLKSTKATKLPRARVPRPSAERLSMH